MKAATLVKPSGKAVEFKETDMFSCMMEHEVKSTKAEFVWKGAKIVPSQWREVMAFFEWTQAEYKSEAQVRAFVHPKDGWLFWAFPQQGNTGMTTKELETEDAKKQRAEQIPAGYIAFGTVHHHCSAAAFQSGTDESDEKAVDGLHITVGNIGSDKYSIHCRIYYKGNKFDVNMAAFWDIGEEACEKLKFVESLGFGVDDVKDRLARDQMCLAPASGQPFHGEWKENYIVTSKAAMQSKLFGAPSAPSSPTNYCPKCGYFHVAEYNCSAGDSPTEADEQCAEQVLKSAMENRAMYGVSEKELFEIIEQLGCSLHSELIQGIIDECDQLGVGLSELHDAAVKYKSPRGHTTASEFWNYCE
jgi:hypothetical protein